ncbi:hypothetical protein Ddye_021769 [Dipteronia dyeriana]|uniref:Pentatricopeptide repeat-containing protein n=1 Tax=Dipteronia dyeriana TaxID=168575 RepID=A0AAD9WWK3_9ROSI|nr:hypothetical protein Ddye_021769 [Dipteronia dyeriana]
MLSSYSQVGIHREALSLFHRMRISNTKPDHFSFTATLSTCAGLNNLQNGAKIHALVIAFGYRCSLPINNSLIDMYGKEIRETSCAYDHWTLSALMNVYGESSEMSFGYMVHALVIITGWSTAIETKNLIISFYTKLSSQSDDIKEFKSIGVLSYARNGDREQVLSFFVDMMRNCMCPNDFTFEVVLNGCSSLAVLGHGRMVNGCVIYYGFHAHVYVGNDLVYMYAKCGDIEGSSHTFNEILDKDLDSWIAMLFGFGMHGLAR